ncbi:MAG: hypothetical protein ACI9PZ_000189 [Parvicella sp.]|jgi:hypothetical protein
MTLNKHEKINYLEFPAQDISLSKVFFAKVFPGNLKTMGLNIPHSLTQVSTAAFIKLTYALVLLKAAL